MSGCAVPDTQHLKDLHAERMVLSGLLHEGRILAEQLTATGLETGHFYSDVHAKAFDCFMYVAYGGMGAIMTDVFNECLRRKTRAGFLGASFGTSLDLALWLSDVWGTCMWLADDPGKGGWRKGMFFWACDPAPPEASLWLWAGLAAAAKVRHMAARRTAAFAAMELLRDAMYPTSDADDLFGRSDKL